MKQARCVAGVAGVAGVAWLVVSCSSSGASTGAPEGIDAVDSAADALDAATIEVGVDAPTLDAPTLDAAPFVPAAHRGWPILGPGKRVMKAPRIVTIIAANDDAKTELAKFSDDLIASDWWAKVSADYGVSRPTESLHVDGPALTTSPNKAGLAAYVASSGAPGPDSNTIFLVYLPTGVTVTDASFVSFHTPYPNSTSTTGDVMAIVGREKPAFGLTQVEELTAVASHELTESATDPNGAGFRLPLSTSTPWTVGVWSAMQTGSVENGDLCEGTRTREPSPDGSLYQRSWSIVAAAAGGDPCVPARDEPFFDVSIPEDWYTAAPGATIDIPLSGWSTAKTDDWLLLPHNEHSTAGLASLAAGSGLSITTSLGIGTKGTCLARGAMNDGATGTLSVAMPSTAVPGDWIVVAVHSFREDDACHQTATGDLFHHWMVGIHVP